MNMNFRNLIIAGLLVQNSNVGFVSCGAVSGDSDKSGGAVADSISRLGIRLDNPLLRLLGKAFSDIERENNLTVKYLKQELCKYHPCSDWTTWSPCDARATLQEFGGQNRSRMCGNTTQCPSLTKQWLEYETRLCHDPCPEGFNDISKKFCLKLFDSDKKYRSDAENICVASGGHLANVDSEEKQSEITSWLSTKGITSGTFWIDGLRTVKAGSWSYIFPVADSEYVNWKSSEPSNMTDELCKVLDYSSGWFWYDRDCQQDYFYICEIN